MAEIVAALIVACLSGITFLAYRHPPAYQRVLSAVTPVAVGLLIGGILLSIYAIFVLSGILNEDLVAKPQSPLDHFQSTVTELYWVARNLVWTLVVAAAISAYLTFLYFLPRILEPPESKNGGNGAE